MSIRLGYVGAGFMAQRVHIPNFATTPGCELVALAELRPQLRQRVAQRYHIAEQYDSHLDMAEKAKLDAVAISGGFADQGQFAMEFLKRGIPVFIEKPFVTTTTDGRLVLAAAKQGGLPPRRGLMVAYMKRYDAGNLIARQAIRRLRESGDAGQITFVRAHGFGGDWMGGIDTPFEKSDESVTGPEHKAFSIYPPFLPEKWQKGYLGFLQQYTHNLNLLRWLLDAGDEASVDFADFDQTGRDWSEKGVRGITVLRVGGIRTTLESGWMSHHQWDEHTQVFFEHGYVKTTSPSLLLKQMPAEVEIYQSKPTVSTLHPVPAPAYSWAYKREAEAFIDAVSNGKEFDSSAEDSMTDVRLYEEIYRKFLAHLGE